MTSRFTRRTFLRTSAALAASAAVTGSLPADEKPLPPSERLNVGVIGVNGRGAGNLAGVGGENVVALCDVDLNRAGKARETYPRAAFDQDFRRLLDRKDVEAVVISTPDHMHAIPALRAMQAGKHVYCEKPLAHTVHEVRVLMAAAAKHKVVTQMGTQIHASENYRRVVELVHAGVIGPVRRVHVWCDKRAEPGQRARAETTVPAGLDYDLWLGPAPYRPYHVSHLHKLWRWWWDFGGGMLADMACHYMDLAHWALGLRTPVTIAAQGKKTYEGDNEVPDLMQVDYEYPSHGSQPPVHLTWYHGAKGPDLSGNVSFKGYGSGVLFEGEKGKLIASYARHALLPEEQFRELARPEKSIPPSPGHHKEWLEAIKHGRETSCNFAYSGALAEAVLLGNVSYRCGKKLEWDGRLGKVTNVPEAANYLEREYRRGWRL